MHTETVLETNDIETVVAARVGDTLGYARVSTNDQNLDAQRARLIEAGAIRVFTDIVSGKRFERPGLAELIDHARPGDRLCVIRLDRLGRSLKELLETVDGLKAHGIHLVSLEERLDTSSAAGEPCAGTDSGVLRGKVWHPAVFRRSQPVGYADRASSGSFHRDAVILCPRKVSTAFVSSTNSPPRLSCSCSM